uniref:EGF-like domain-containing protein n=1 Tax=Panagrolaimus sp. JU765 TaxID=591449 RepID=A0AC34RPW2_9BILA
SLTKPKCIDVNECEVDGLNDCDKKNGTCVNTVGSFQCKCKKGYREQPPDYTTCKDVDECKEGNNNCDKTNALCVNTPGGYDCQCKPGFFGDGETCQDGSFKCECKPGYTVGEKGCEDINECLSPETNNCSKTTGDVRLKCVNEPGSYSCVCPSGYAQVAKDKCTDIDECKQSPSVCPNFEPDTCINTNGSFTCGCKSGYAKPKNCEDPKKCACVDIDECLVGTKVNGKFKPACGPNAKCQNTLGAHKCECSEGYSGDAYNEGCKISDACKAKNPCDKDTQDCVSAGDKAVCACKKGYLPTNNDKCQKNPCLKDRGGCGKGAVCVPVKVEENIQPVCKCKPGQQLDDQKNCEAVDQCQCKTPVPIGTPCHSKVRCNADKMLCVNLGTSANCTCQRGFKLSKDGKSCDNIDECKEGVEANPKNVACDPQAKCIDAIGSFECDCPRGQRENHEHKCVPDVDCTKE